MSVVIANAKKSSRPRRKFRPAFVVMVVPMACLFFFFHTYPFLKGVFYSFTNWQGYGAWRFTGLKNYLWVFTDPGTRQAYIFTFKFAVIATVLTNVLGLLLALGLNAKIKYKSFLRATFVLPWVLSSIVVSFMWKFIIGTLLPQWGQTLNISALSTSVLGTENSWLGPLFVCVWSSLAFTSLIYISGLQTIDVEVHEAAEIDGATGWKKFRSIIFPLIIPFFTINVVLSFKNYMGVFDQILAMTNGGPGNASTSVTMEIYRAFDGGAFDVQQANSVVLFLIIAIITLVYLWVSDRHEKQAS